jgi:TPR repeat protein
VLKVRGIEQARAQDVPAALASFEAAAAAGSPTAATNLHTLRRQLNNKVSRQDIAAPMTRTNEKDAQAMYQLAQLHHTGEGILFNQTQAIRLYAGSARLGYVPAQRLIGLLNQASKGQLSRLTTRQFQELARVDTKTERLKLKPFVHALLLIDEDPLIGLDLDSSR